MTTCARCGAPPAASTVGRYCTNCGAPRDQPVRTALEPPPVHTAPPPQRFPLYADEAPAPAPEPVPVPLLLAPEPGGRRRRPGRRWLPWLATVVAVALLATIGLSLRGADPDDEPAAGPDPSASPSGAAPSFDGAPTELAGAATADAARSGADSVDISTGEPTTYEPANMLDGDPTTAWRVKGDATGETLTFTFPEPVVLTSLGLVNGYAKTSVDGSGTEFDLYAGSRRVLEAEWVLDGGDPLPQVLQDGVREPQLLDVGAVEASVVELRLVRVSEPGAGAGARDTTAISEVSLSGYRP